MFRSLVLLVGGLASLNAVFAVAQNAVLGQKYGQGVHEYFSGNYLNAYQQLTSAIEGGSKDPRVFYFRGLAYLKLGRAPEATQDFHKGAALESSDVNTFYNAPKALERVQGPARIELERYRVDARMAAMERAEKIRKARYEAIQREESRVLRQQPLTEPEPVETPEPAAKPEAESSEAADVFTPPATDDPFAAKPAKPAAKPAGAKKGGVLGAMGKALGKAVADKEGDKAPAEKKAVDTADAENPFGEMPATEEKPDDETKPDDPFAQ